MAQHILTYKDNALEKNGGLVSLTLNIDPTLENNTWDTIAKAFKSGLAPSGWLGQTKEITSGAYNGYHLQLVDMQHNRYERVGGGYTNAVFQLVEALPDYMVMNDSDTNAGGWADSKLRQVLNTTIYNELPLDLQHAISKCKVKSSIGGTSTTTNESENWLFLPSEYELCGQATYSIGASEGTPQYDYYITHNTDADRIKKRYVEIGGQTYYVATYYWLRSPVAPNLFVSNTQFERVGTDGTLYVDVANSQYEGVCPAFAI